MNTEENEIKKRGRTLSINTDKDLVRIREFGRQLARKIGFSENERTLIATAISEIVRNVLTYAGSGEVEIKATRAPDGIMITIRDRGTGIKDLEKALCEGYSTGEGLGIGLPGAKRIMDTFEIITGPKGTVVKMSKLFRDKNLSSEG